MATDRRVRWSIVDHRTAGKRGSQTRLAIIDERRRPGDPTFIAIQGFRSWIEPFEMQRFTLIAEVLRARLIVVEVPGFGAAGSRLLPAERRALWVGDFGPLAARMFEAARDILDDAEREQPLSFLGYSMGASIAAAMVNVAAAQGWTVDRLVLVEPVAMHRWRLRELVAATRREDALTEQYLATNDVVQGAIPPWDRRAGERPATQRHLDLAVLAVALRHGGLGIDLPRVSGRLRQMVIVRAHSSGLSQGDLGAPAVALRHSGPAVVDMVVPGHHAFWHSLPAVWELANRLAAVLNDALV